MAYNAVTVTNSATLIVAANPGRRNLTIVNHGSVDIFIGPDSSVTASNGIPFYSGSTRDQDKIPEGYTGAVYGITASSSSDVRYWEVVGT